MVIIKILLGTDFEISPNKIFKTSFKHTHTRAMN